MKMILIVMGVSGSGKSTVGRMLGEKLQWAFEDGDDYHPPSNKTKMSSGIPLDDRDRYQWLLNLNSVIQKRRSIRSIQRARRVGASISRRNPRWNTDIGNYHVRSKDCTFIIDRGLSKCCRSFCRRWQKSNQHGIIVCSALKRKYRQVLLLGAKAKYSDTEVTLSFDFQNKHCQDIRTDSKSDNEFTDEVEQLRINRVDHQRTYQSMSKHNLSVQDVPAISSQREEEPPIVQNKDNCPQAGHEHHQVIFIHLSGSMELISSRLVQRKGHFFNPGLLHSQFDTLEELGADEDGLVVDVSKSLDSVVSQIEAHVLPLVSKPNSYS